MVTNTLVKHYETCTDYDGKIRHMAEKSSKKVEGKCFWCGKPGTNQHVLVKDNATSEQQAGVFLCDVHNAEMEMYRRKRIASSEF